MNPAQQKAHTLRTNELGRAIAKLEEGVERELEQLADDLSTAITAERTDRINVVTALRTSLDTGWQHTGSLAGRIDVLELMVIRFIDMSFWQRFRWLVTGRTL